MFLWGIFFLTTVTSTDFLATSRVKELLFKQGVLLNDVVDVGVGLSRNNSRVFWHACTRYTHALVQMMHSVEFRVFYVPICAVSVLLLALAIQCLD